jgi:hypothetical protein
MNTGFVDWLKEVRVSVMLRDLLDVLGSWYACDDAFLHILKTSYSCEWLMKTSHFPDCDNLQLRDKVNKLYNNEINNIKNTRIHGTSTLGSFLQLRISKRDVKKAGQSKGHDVIVSQAAKLARNIVNCAGLQIDNIHKLVLIHAEKCASPLAHAHA